MVAPNDTPVVETVAAEQGEQQTDVVKPVVAEVEDVVDKTAEVEAVVDSTAEVEAVVDSTAEVVADEPEMDDASLMAKAKDLFAEGKVAYIKLAYEMAQDKLSECCEMITTVEGDKSSSLYNPMLYLAKTLLDLSRMEQPVVENALTGLEDTADDSTAEEEKEKTEGKIDTDVVDDKNADDVADKVIEALDENAAEADAAQRGEKPSDVEAKEEQAKEAETSEEAVVGVDAPAAEGATDDGSESTATDDITNIQLAYENAATARLIASIELDKAESDDKKSEWKANVAEALLLLGEVCIADEQYESAITELTSCEKVQTEMWSLSDRRIAETYFQFGRAYTNMGRFGDAGDVYNKALKVLTLLKDETSTRQSSEEDETKKKELVDEVTKLDALIKDVESWVKDSIDSHKSRMEAEEANKEETASGSAVGTTTAEGDTAKDISGLVRKRKADSPSAATDGKVEASPIAGDSPMKENDVGAEVDAAVVAKKARLSSEDVAKEAEVTK